GRSGSEGGNGGDGTNRRLTVLGPYYSSANTLIGGNGGYGKPCGRGGRGNDSTVSGEFTIRDGTSC
ncbi:hypothetical protein, partial [Streptomyces rimosus]